MPREVARSRRERFGSRLAARPGPGRWRGMAGAFASWRSSGPRQRDEAVRAEAHVAAEGHSLARVRAAVGRRVVAHVREVRGVGAPVAVEAEIPRARARQADAVARERPRGEVGDHDDVVARAALRPPVKRDDLGVVIHVKDVDLVPLEAAGVAVPVASNLDEVAVEIREFRRR